MESEDGGDRFESASRSQSVSVQGFGGTDCQFVCVRTEHFADGTSLHGIISRSSGSVGIDIAYLFRLKTSFPQCRPYRARGPVDGRLGEVVSVGGHP